MQLKQKTIKLLNCNFVGNLTSEFLNTNYCCSTLYRFVSDRHLTSRVTSESFNLCADMKLKYKNWTKKYPGHQITVHCHNTHLHYKTTKCTEKSNQTGSPGVNKSRWMGDDPNIDNYSFQCFYTLINATQDWWGLNSLYLYQVFLLGLSLITLF